MEIAGEIVTTHSPICDLQRNSSTGDQPHNPTPAGVTSMERVCLLNKEHIVLSYYETDPTRFVEVFQHCWKLVPTDVKAELLAHWSKIPHGPSLELSRIWAGHQDNCATTTQVGHVLKFDADAFEVLPWKVAKWIIAHELAHVYQKTRGRLPGGESEDKNEAHADSIAVEWGFDDLPNKTMRDYRYRTNASLKDACDWLRRISPDCDQP